MTNKDRRWLGLFAILTAMIMNILDSTIVNVAGPTIRADLGGSYESLQWISAAYTLALAVGLLTGGRLGDMYGRRRVLTLGTAGFLLASLACAAAWSPGSLIAFRSLQGLCGAILIPQCFGLIRDLFPPAQIGKAFGALGPVIGLSTILGPIVAGLLIRSDLLGSGWRSVFLINLPLGLFTLLAGRIALPVGVRSARTGLDFVGSLIAGAGMCLVVYPLVQGRERGWPGWMFAMMAASVAVFAAFVIQQRRRTRAGRTPLVELSVFAKRSFTSGVAFVTLFFGAIAGFSLAVGLFLQLGLGASPTRASLTMSGWALGAFVGTGFGATMMGRLGRRILHIGLTLMAAGLVGTYVTLGQAGHGWWPFALPLTVYGAGMGMIFVPLFDIIMGDITDREVGSAASLLESLQQLGASLGVAVLVTVFFAHVGPTGDFLGAARVVNLLALALTAATFALGFRLPRKARRHDAAPDAPETESAEPELVAV